MLLHERLQTIRPVEMLPLGAKHGDRVALEWSSDATLTDGRPITYRGVTVIDLDGDKVGKLRTYYDSAQFTATTATST